MSCLTSVVLKSLLKLFGKTYKVEEVSEYADFYWKFLENMDKVETTQSDQLPGFTHYHNMLKSFIRKHEEGVDSANVQEPHNYDEIYEYTKVMKWLSNETYTTNNEFTNIQTWLEHQNDPSLSSSDNTDQSRPNSPPEHQDYTSRSLNYCTVRRKDHDAISQSSDNSSIYTYLSPWEVTRKPATNVDATHSGAGGQHTMNSFDARPSHVQDSIWV